MNPGAIQREKFWGSHISTQSLAARFRLDFPEFDVYNRAQPPIDENRTHPGQRCSPHKIRCLGWADPGRIPERISAKNMVALFENARSGDLESHLCSLELQTRADAERVIAWMEIQVAERSGGRTAFEAETCVNKGICSIEAPQLPTD